MGGHTQSIQLTTNNETLKTQARNTHKQQLHIHTQQTTTQQQQTKHTTQLTTALNQNQQHNCVCYVFKQKDNNTHTTTQTQHYNN
jgi:hypothetical protein